RHSHPTVTDAFRRFMEQRFDGVPWHLSPSGLPRIDDAVLYVEGPIVDTAPAGDHRIVRVEPEVVETGPGEEPLVFYRGQMMTVDEVRESERVWQLGSIDWDTHHG
ncbi:MAG TPA: flavin reductase, partial [Dermatophilaceae bacterium]|nr:flavin reductase [Dermatophilaceae bacterium]